ncbi:MAG: nitrate reductase cytochrome c-type subunit [Alphaproteobacteria bacterium]
MIRFLLILGGSFGLALMALAAEENIATLRGASIGEAPKAPPMSKVSDTDLRRVRNYPEQPPTIPHAIDGYQVDLNSNRCLTCHSRVATGESQAPMISITHFMDREGQFLASVSPRRYFCTQCHVVQHEVRAPVANEFVDIDTLLATEPQPTQD